MHSIETVMGRHNAGTTDDRLFDAQLLDAMVDLDHVTDYEVVAHYIPTGQTFLKRQKHHQERLFNPDLPAGERLVSAGPLLVCFGELSGLELAKGLLVERSVAMLGPNQVPDPTMPEIFSWGQVLVGLEHSGELDERTVRAYLDLQSGYGFSLSQTLGARVVEQSALQLVLLMKKDLRRIRTKLSREMQAATDRAVVRLQAAYETEFGIPFEFTSPEGRRLYAKEDVAPDLGQLTLSFAEQQD